MTVKLIEWTGALLGLIGSALLASHTEVSGYGFLFFLASNACWVFFSIHKRAWGLLTMQAGFTATSLLGIYRWVS